MTDLLTIADMQVFTADLHARCKPRDGYVTTSVVLMLNAEEIAAVDAIARFLALITPFREDILKIINGPTKHRRAV